MNEYYRPAAPFKRYKREINGHQLVGRSREMLCGSGYVRSLISDAAPYECTLQEQSPVAPSAMRYQETKLH